MFIHSDNMTDYENMVLSSVEEFTGIHYGGIRDITLVCFGGSGILLPNIKVWFIESHQFCLAGLI